VAVGFIAISMAAARIYREYMLRVTTSHNRLGLFLSKRIRHGFVAKINDKRRSGACEALDWILTDYSCARRAPVPIASPWPGEVRQASARVCFSISPLFYTLASA
jgi:hypothetical protein